MMRACVSLLVFLAAPAFAQLDPSSALLLNSRPKPSPKESGLDSGRYTVRPARPTTEGPARDDRKSRTGTESSGGSQDLQDNTSPANQVIPSSGPGETTIQNQDGAVILPAPAVGTDGESAGLTDQMQDIVLGGSMERIQRYRNFIHPDDSRLNLLDIVLSPTFVYNDSKSTLWYRSYNTSGPAISTEARVWVTPFFGLSGSYMATLGGHMSNSPTSSTSIAAAHQWFRVGARGRRHFGLSRLSPSLTFGLDFREYQLRVPGDDDMRVRLKTVGPSLVVEGEVPSSLTHSWLMGLEFAPRSRHQEIATELSLQSGTSSETNTIGLSLGSRTRFNRSNAIQFKLSYTLEKTLYSGSSNTPDPLTGTTLTGVPVTNSFLIFQMGYFWGN